MRDSCYEELGLPSVEALRRGGGRLRSVTLGPRGRPPPLLVLAAKWMRAPQLPQCPPTLLPYVLAEVVRRDDAPTLAKLMSTWPLDAVDLRLLRLCGKNTHGYVTLALRALSQRERADDVMRVDLRGVDCTVAVLEALLEWPAKPRVTVLVDLLITPLSFELFAELATREPQLGQLAVSRLHFKDVQQSVMNIVLDALLAAPRTVLAELHGVACEVAARPTVLMLLERLIALPQVPQQLAITWTGSTPTFGDEPLVSLAHLRRLELTFCSGARLPDMLASLVNLEVLVLSYPVLSKATFCRALEALAPRNLRHLTVRTGLRQAPPELLASLSAGLVGSRASLRSLILALEVCPSPVDLLQAVLPLPHLTHLAVRNCAFRRESGENEAPLTAFARLLRLQAPCLEYLSLVGANLQDSDVDGLLEALQIDHDDCRLRLLDLRQVVQAERWGPKRPTPFGRLQVTVGSGPV